jgi:hypothetical protein
MSKVYEPILKRTYDIKLIDDGTLDTVISVNGVQYRFNYEGEGAYEDFIKFCKDEAIEMYEEGL